MTKSIFRRVVLGKWLWTAGVVAGAGGAPWGCTASEIEGRFASSVEAYTSGTNQPKDAPYADPTRALGPPDGRTVALGVGSSLLVRFFRPIPDGRGPDLRVTEIGPDDARGLVAVSEDGITFYEYAHHAESASGSDFDLGESRLSSVMFVRVRGADDAGLDPGFDLDAIGALH